ncbi:hypothetical protein AX16_009633 [Volvariella volvacea WC 439]|nr:hypothetical protein AX16_009633 [Volvariella volvacea WC 439]
MIVRFATLLVLQASAAIAITNSQHPNAHIWDTPGTPRRRSDRNPLNTNADGSSFIWVPQDEYSGTSFFDRWDFFSAPDPTNGHVNYVDAETAFQKRLVYFEEDGTVIMKGDNTTWLPLGTYRDSVRISSHAQYNGGLFILDLNRAPWGCGTWPAFWTLGSGLWPWNGEIDIIEGVHDNQHNQVAWHTGDGCHLNPNATFSGTVLHTNCFALTNQNSGCGITEWSRASYGPYFDSQAGGMFAMKWDENGIAVWSFYRAAIPQDILEGHPDPSNWGVPSAALDPSGCDIGRYFANHSIIFDITYCGDWAGNSYATSGCPGTCEERLMDPSNFVNASWSINSLKVYRKQVLNGRISNAAILHPPYRWQIWMLALVALIILLLRH